MIVQSLISSINDEKLKKYILQAVQKQNAWVSKNQIILISYTIFNRHLWKKSLIKILNK